MAFIRASAASAAPLARGPAAKLPRASSPGLGAAPAGDGVEVRPLAESVLSMLGETGLSAAPATGALNTENALNTPSTT